MARALLGNENEKDAFKFRASKFILNDFVSLVGLHKTRA
jgi:hypothetical protein